MKQTRPAGYSGTPLATKRGIVEGSHLVAKHVPADYVHCTTFRPLLAGDLPMLHDWLCRPHVAAWWGAATSYHELEIEYVPCIAPESTTRCYIAMLAGEPSGFFQSYVVLGSGDGWWPDETDPGARGIDQFLANADQLGRGVGSALVSAFVDQLFLDPAVTQVQTDPSPGNLRAIRCYLKAGFVPHARVFTPDGPALLMLRARNQAPGRLGNEGVLAGGTGLAAAPQARQ